MTSTGIFSFQDVLFLWDDEGFDYVQHEDFRGTCSFIIIYTYIYICIVLLYILNQSICLAERCVCEQLKSGLDWRSVRGLRSTFITFVGFQV